MAAALSTSKIKFDSCTQKQIPCKMVNKCNNNNNNIQSRPSCKHRKLS